MKKFLLFFLIALPVFAQEKVLDGVAAIVDDEIILMNELEFQLRTVSAQQKIDMNTPGLKLQVLNLMIDEKLLLAQAKYDSISVSEADIARQVDYQISVLTQQFGSIEKVEQVYQMNLQKIKREVRTEVEKNMLIQRVKESKFGGIEVSRRETEEFFSEYKDSLGLIPEKVTISHIFKNPKSTDTNKEKFRAFAQSLLDSLKAGADFSALAKKYSDDAGTAPTGGDLGFVKRGIFVPEFESAAWDLAPGETSSIVESPFGFHIIQMIDKKGETANVRHILIKVKADDSADNKAIALLIDIRDSVLANKNTFAHYAKLNSDDKATAPFGGSLGTLFLTQLNEDEKAIVTKLKDGEISLPKRINFGSDQYGYHIMYLEKRLPEHAATIEGDYEDLRSLALEYKRQRLYAEWIAELKTSIYWKNNIEGTSL